MSKPVTAYRIDKSGSLRRVAIYPDALERAQKNDQCITIAGHPVSARLIFQTELAAVEDALCKAASARKRFQDLAEKAAQRERKFGQMHENLSNGISNL